MTNSDFPTDQTFHQFHDLYTELDLHRIMSGFHGAFATGVASQQGTLTPPDTWFRPSFSGACICSECWDRFSWFYTDLETVPNLTFTEFRGLHKAFATGVASHQGALTLPDTWFRPPFWDLLMFQLLRPNSSNLPCLYSTFHLEYPLVLSRFCFVCTIGPKKSKPGLVEHVEILIPVKCRWIPFSCFREEWKMPQSIRGRMAILLSHRPKKKQNW